MLVGVADSTDFVEDSLLRDGVRRAEANGRPNQYASKCCCCGGHSLSDMSRNMHYHGTLMRELYRRARLEAERLKCAV